MALFRTCGRSIFFSLVAFLALVSAAQARSRFHGNLDPGLHSSLNLLNVATFHSISAASAAIIGVASRPGDRLYAGAFDLGSDTRPSYRIRAVIVCSPDGSDVLYADANQDSHLDPDERFSFRPLPRTAERAGQKDVARFNADLPGDLMGPFPMEVRLIEESESAQASPGELPVLYSGLAFVQGYVRLAHHKIRVRFQYDFATRSVDIDHAREWLDLNGDRKFDMTPGSGESLHANGSAPVFRVGHLTLQLSSVDLRMGTFVLRKVTPSAETR